MATTITVEEPTLERFNELKSDHNEPNMPEMSADGFLNTLMDTLEAVDEGHYGERDDPLTPSEVDEIADQLNESLNVGSGSVDESALAEALADYLINGENLPEKIAGELR